MALHDVLKDWVVSELSVPHASVNGHAYQVVICASYLHKQSYDDLEASCFALNGWLATTGHDIWLLAFKEKKLSMVFIQRLTDIDNASAKLESLGYYSNYEDQDYQRLVKHRKDRRISYDEKTNA